MVGRDFKVDVSNKYTRGSGGITMGTNIDCREGQTAPINVGCEIALFFIFQSLFKTQQYQVIQSACTGASLRSNYALTRTEHFFSIRDQADSRAKTFSVKFNVFDC